MGIGGRGDGGHTVGAHGGQQRGQGPWPCSREGARSLEGDDGQTDKQTLSLFYRETNDDNDNMNHYKMADWGWLTNHYLKDWFMSMLTDITTQYNVLSFYKLRIILVVYD